MCTLSRIKTQLYTQWGKAPCIIKNRIQSNKIGSEQGNTQESGAIKNPTNQESE